MWQHGLNYILEAGNLQDHPVSRRFQPTPGWTAVFRILAHRQDTARSGGCIAQGSPALRSRLGYLSPSVCSACHRHLTFFSSTPLNNLFLDALPCSFYSSGSLYTVLSTAMKRSSSRDSMHSDDSDSSVASSGTLSSTYSPPPPRVSKREYLLAQIRHKDQIIGSLLKQVNYRSSLTCCASP